MRDRDKWNDPWKVIEAGKRRKEKCMELCNRSTTRKSSARDFLLGSKCALQQSHHHQCLNGLSRDYCDLTTSLSDDRMILRDRHLGTMSRHLHYW